MQERKVAFLSGVVVAGLLVACSGEPLPSGLLESPKVAGAIATLPSYQVDAYVTSRDEALGLPSMAWLQLQHGSVVGFSPEVVAQATLRALAGPYHLTEAALALVTTQPLHDVGQGPRIVKFAQQQDGIEVFARSLRLAVGSEGLPLLASGNLATAVEPVTRVFALSEQAATAAALQAVTKGQATVTGVQRTGTAVGAFSLLAVTAQPHESADTQAAEQRYLLLGPARSKRVYFPTTLGLLPAYYVELSVGRSDSVDALQQAVVVSAVDGALLFQKDLTESDVYTYRVWADASGFQPWDGPQGTNMTPHPTGLRDASSPTLRASNRVTLANVPFSKNDPWLPPAATSASGNNVVAYADLAAPDGVGAGDVTLTPSVAGEFDRVLDPALDASSTPESARAATTQLFYTLNYMHDTFYDAGFHEASGNPQLNNFGRGGQGGDPILAEAQDYSGRNNANAATPADGASPRIQMYLFDASNTSLVVQSPADVAGNYENTGAQYNPSAFDVTGELVLVNDGTGGVAVPSDGCEYPFVNNAAVAGKVAVVDRGDCSFVLKSKNAQLAGAKAVVIVNNVAGAIAPSGTDATITIPSLVVSLNDGTKLKTRMKTAMVTVRLRGARGVRDGSLDAAIVSHEWGHVLSNRLVGNSSGLVNNQGRGLGEGWSDFVALLMMVRPEDAAVPSNASWNGAYAVGSWALWSLGNNAFYDGIRRYPYSSNLAKNPLMLRHIQDGTPLPATPPAAFGADGGNNAEVHNTGEVWAVMLWDCYTAMLRDTARYTVASATKRMREYLVGSLKLTPSSPTLLEARDAVLAVVFATDAQDYRLFWQAFARRGAGQGAVVPGKTSVDNVGVTESFDVSNNLLIESVTLTDTVKSCDSDGILDNDEVGRFAVVVRNIGVDPLTKPTLKITSQSPKVTLVTPAQVSVSALGPTQAATVMVDVAMQGADPAQAFTVDFEASDPGLPAGRIARRTYAGLGNIDYLLRSGLTETANTTSSVWQVWADPALEPSQNWVRAVTSSSGIWRGAAAALTSDHALVSPVLQVAPTGSMGFTVRHRYRFQADLNGRYDGGVIEVSSDGGVNWTDVGTRLVSGGYSATLYKSLTAQNPLAGRKAFTADSAGYGTEAAPGYVYSVVDFQDAYAGQAVQVRFRIGTDEAIGSTGWDIDEVVFTGITNRPFATQVGHRGVCGPRRLVVQASAAAAMIPGGTGGQLNASTLETINGPGTPDGGVTFAWTQTEGPTVQLSSAAGAAVSFTAPHVDADTVLTFQVVGSDGQLTSDPATVSIVVTLSGQDGVGGTQASGCQLRGRGVPSTALQLAATTLLLAGLLLRRRRLANRLR